MKRVTSWVLLALCLFIAYQGYENSRQSPVTEAQAKGVACNVDPTCVVHGERPHTLRTDVFRREYEWNTSVGAVSVSCKRAYMFLGSWSCVAKKGPLR